MVNGRNKGAAFEREIAKMLYLDLGVNFKRDIEQYREAKHGDLICEDPTFPFTLELKRYAKGFAIKSSWWEQVEEAAENEGKEPALIYKFDHKPILVAVRLAFIMQDESYDEHIATVTWSGFMQLVREAWNDPHRFN